MIVYNKFDDLYSDVYILYSGSDDVPSTVITYDMADDIAIVKEELVNLLRLRTKGFERVTNRDEFVYEVMDHRDLEMESFEKEIPPQTITISQWRR